MKIVVVDLNNKLHVFSGDLVVINKEVGNFLVIKLKTATYPKNMEVLAVFKDWQYWKKMNDIKPELTIVDLTHEDKYAKTIFILSNGETVKISDVQLNDFVEVTIKPSL